MGNEEFIDMKIGEEEYEFNDEVFRVAENMQKYGGGFVKKLGIALSHADRNNTMRIKNAFPDYWEQYKNIENYKK